MPRLTKSDSSNTTAQLLNVHVETGWKCALSGSKAFHIGFKRIPLTNETKKYGKV